MGLLHTFIYSSWQCACFGCFGDNNNAVRIDNDANNIAVRIDSDDNINEEKTAIMLEGDDNDNDNDKERGVFLYIW